MSAATVAATVVVARLCSARVVISGEGTDVRYPRRVLLWDDVTSTNVVETLNRRLNRRLFRLDVATRAGR